MYRAFSYWKILSIYHDYIIKNDSFEVYYFVQKNFYFTVDIHLIAVSEYFIAVASPWTLFQVLTAPITGLN